MFEEVRFWLGTGVDGLRLDAITTLADDPGLRDNPPRHVDQHDLQPITWQEWIYTRDQPRTLEVLGQLRSLINQYDDRYLIGEVADVDLITVSAKYTRTGKHLHSCYNFSLTQSTFSASFLKAVIEKTEAVLGTGWTTWAMSNHDNMRVVSRFGRSADLQGNNRALAKVLMARDGCRTPMPWSSQLPNAGFSTAKPWLPVPREHLGLAVDKQEEDPDSVLQTFRRFVAWRKQHPALVVGDLAMVASTNPLLAFERYWEGERLLCVFNFSNREVSQPVSSDWRSIDGHGFDATLEGHQLFLSPFGAWFGQQS